MFGLPDSFLIAIIFLLGLIFGSFFDVFVSRFHTGKSINGRSHCLSCGHMLNWYELFPILSFLFLKGRCLKCHARIPVRLFFMELFTALLFVYVFVNVKTPTLLFFGLTLMSLFIVIALYDIRHMIIPDIFVAVTAIFALVLLVVTAEGDVLSHVFTHVFAGVGVTLFYGLLWFVSRGRWIGFGDVKLALPLGLMLSYTEAFSFVVLSFWVGAGISLSFLCFQHLLKGGKRILPFLDIPLTMKSEVPFAPFMLIAFSLVFFSHVNVFEILKISF